MPREVVSSLCGRRARRRPLLRTMLLSSARTATASAGLGRRAASSLALKYSNAIFNAALHKSPQTLNKVQSELTALSSAIKDDHSAGLVALYAAAEGPKKEPVTDITKNLFVVLSENGRLAEAQGVIEGFHELVSKHRGELTVTITSAAPLPSDIQRKLEASLKQSQAAQQAKSVKVANKINPAVLGGIVVDFGDKTIDLSVQSRVTRLNGLMQ
ncbi:ATP synthase delta subunit-domain-containing protein, partial [Fomitopsis serialis]|uniref:ATP synthase delta subunit-domain-containing protein n=1 Tax=Fomitopsis serialis TaxID=139415 RepID=UPI00200773A6